MSKLAIIAMYMHLLMVGFSQIKGRMGEGVVCMNEVYRSHRKVIKLFH